MKLVTYRLVFLSLLTSLSCTAQKSGAIDYPQLGLHFDIPEGWVGSESEIGFIIGHNEIPGVIMVVPHETRDIETLKAEASVGMHDSNGTSMSKIGYIVDYDDGSIGAYYTGTMEWKAAKSFAIGMVSPYGPGVSIMVFCAEGLYDDSYEQLIKQIHGSVVFKQPDTAAITQGWKEFVGGYRLRQLDSNYSNSYGSNSGYTGSSTDITLDLCPDGSFAYLNKSHVSVGTGGSSVYSENSGAENGRWEIGASLMGGPILRLQFNSGEVSEQALGVSENMLYLNGTRTFRLSGDEGPACR